MSPSLELYENVQDELPVEPVVTKINSVPGVAAVELKDIEKSETVLKYFRAYIADLCQQFNGGHPGRVHVIAARYDSLCPGHPEIENEGIEVTTGPLGQGVANAVGLAVASKHLSATYNRQGHEVVDNMTWCMIGHACLQEGVGLEAVSLAGHWKLNNLCIIYDNNNITCDGTANVANAAEDVNAKMRATGWNVIDILNGHSNVSAIVHALLTTKASEKPTFANIRTVIGFGSGKAGSASVHGAAIGLDDIVSIKKSFGLSPEEHYTLPDEVYSFFEDVAPRGRQLEAQWAKTMNSYEQQFPELTAKFKLRVAGNMPQDLTKFNPRKEDFPKEPTATHKSAGLVGNPLSENMNNFLVGTADLTPSCNVAYTKKVDFQNPDLKTVCGLDGDYTGRYLHYGIREHAMAGITNGLCAFNKGTFLSVTSSFFMFYLYAAPSVRMATLQGLQQIHIATHDSIGTGEDGPTHQSIALATLYRAMPNLLYMRPCDSEEVAGAFEVAIGATSTPSIISLSRQALPQWPQSCHAGSAKGAYIFVEEQDFNVTIISTGSEMTFAMQTRDILKTSHNITAHVISFSVPRLFEQQSREYKQSVLRSKEGKPAVVIEAYAPNGWERYADASSRCGCLEI